MSAPRLGADPLGLVRALPREEWEVAAHIAAPLAYGSVGLLRAAITAVLGTLGDRPTAALLDWTPGTFVHARPDFVYRMTRAEDVDALLTGLAGLIAAHGSLGAAFGAGDDGEGDLRAALTRYVHRLRAQMPAPPRRGARYLTPDPATGSATKRWWLMLRWLVRPDDGVDLGLWRARGPERLVLPLDTHTSRLARWLGLSERRTVDYRMARQATDALLEIDPADPLRYDMPLCHLGIAGDCRHEFVPDVCGRCALRGLCQWTRGGSA